MRPIPLPTLIPTISATTDAVPSRLLLPALSASRPARCPAALRAAAGMVLAAGLGLGAGAVRADAAAVPHRHDIPAETPPPERPAAAPASGLPAVQAEVRKVDAPRGQLTLRHADIPNLEMPAMTMVFEVADPAMLDGVRAGDRVVFTADHPPGGRITVRSLSPAPAS